MNIKELQTICGEYAQRPVTILLLEVWEVEYTGDCSECYEGCGCEEYDDEFGQDEDLDNEPFFVRASADTEGARRNGSEVVFKTTDDDGHLYMDAVWASNEVVDYPTNEFFYAVAKGRLDCLLGYMRMDAFFYNLLKGTEDEQKVDFLTITRDVCE